MPVLSTLKRKADEEWVDIDLSKKKDESQASIQ